MKKISILLIAAAGLAFSACEDDLATAIPQHNEQGPVLVGTDIKSEPAGVLASTAVLDLESYNRPDAVIPVMKLVEADSLPAGSSLYYEVELSDSESFGRVKTLRAEAQADGVYAVSAEDWNAAHVWLFGKSPSEKTAYWRVPVYVLLDGSNYRLNGASYYAAEGTIKETCFDLGFTIEENYYLLGGATTWDLTEAVNYPFVHQAGVSVYDDPVFSINLTVTDEMVANGGCYWKIATPQAVESGSWDTVIGVENNGDDSLTGFLLGGNPGAALIVEAGKYTLTVNMETMTYELTGLKAPAVLYAPGDGNGWNFDNCPVLQLVDNSWYYGVLPLAGQWGFQLTPAPNWDIKYGPGGNSSDLSGDLTTSGNIGCDLQGLYWCKVTIDPEEVVPDHFELTELTSVGLIGSFAASGWGADVEMTSADGGATWTCDVALNAGEKYKVRFNNSWDINLGGDPSKLSQGGSDIVAEETGDFTVTLTFQPGYPAITLTKK